MADIIATQNPSHNLRLFDDQDGNATQTECGAGRKLSTPKNASDFCIKFATISTFWFLHTTSYGCIALGTGQKKAPLESGANDDFVH